MRLSLKNQDNPFHPNSTRPNVGNSESESSRGKNKRQDDDAGPRQSNAVGHRQAGHSIDELIPDDRRGGTAGRPALGYDHFSCVYKSGDPERPGNDRCPRENVYEQKRDKLTNDGCAPFEGQSKGTFHGFRLSPPIYLILIGYVQPFIWFRLARKIVVCSENAIRTPIGAYPCGAFLYRNRQIERDDGRYRKF